MNLISNKKLFIKGEILWNKRTHTFLVIHIFLYRASYRFFTQRRLSIYSISAFLSKSSNDFMVLAKYFSHLIMTNIESVPGDGKHSAEFQATEKSGIFKQSLSLSFSVKCIIRLIADEEIVMIDFQIVSSFFFKLTSVYGLNHLLTVSVHHSKYYGFLQKS